LASRSIHVITIIAKILTAIFSRPGVCIMKCEIIPITMKLKRDFVVAGGRENLKRNFIIVIEGRGLGEAAGSIHYGATSRDIERDLLHAARILKDSDISKIAEIMEKRLDHICPPAFCAVSTAVHDFMAKSRGIPLYDHFGLQAPTLSETSITVSVGDVKALADKIKAGYRCIKIKMDDSSQDDNIIGLIRESRKTRFRIDANGSWSYERATDIMKYLPREKLELIEQPFDIYSQDDWNRLRHDYGVPLIVDENVTNADDVNRVSGFADGVNIKIQKSGRLETAIEAINKARQSGLKIMLGCMIESSVGIATAFHLSHRVDFLDLDGRLLVEGDPFRGLDYERGIIKPVGRMGHGISFK